MMKKIAIVVCALAALVSCGKQDTIYKQWVKEGGYIYPAKPIELTATSGYQRIVLEWMAPMDPSIRSTKLYWDNYTDSLEFSYSDYKDGFLSTQVKNLDDRSYTFDVVNFDAKGNRSLAAEITTTPFGESWLLSHAERSLMDAVMDGDEAVITMSKSTDEMVATKFRYLNKDGVVVESDYLEPGQTEMRLPNAMKGKRVEYKSAFVPSTGTDTVWFLSWQKPQDPILYMPDTKDWTVTATRGQVYGTYTPEKIIDGEISSSSRWHSSRVAATAKKFPKILVIDTGESNDRLSYTSFIFYQSPNGPTYRYLREVIVYVGDTPFDPNEADPEANFGTPAAKTTFIRTEEIQSIEFKPAVSGRYIALVFTDCYGGNNYLDLWELLPYGYIPSDVDW